MIEGINIQEGFFPIGPYPVDLKSIVGTGMRFETIDELLTYANNTNGKPFFKTVISDKDTGVIWQLYKVSGTWYARVYDGTYYVKAINIAGTTPLVGTDIQGSVTADGVLCEEGDVVLCPSWLGPLNGIYIVHEDEPWERVSIFDESTDTLTGVIFVATEGTNYKNSQWIYSTKGTIVPDETLAVGYSDWVSDSETFATYTWLNFEMIGRQHPGLILTGATPDVYMHSFDILCNTASNDITINRANNNFVPFKEYKMFKASHLNEVLFTINGIYYGLLLNKRDYLKVKLIKNPYDPYNDTVEDSFIFESNREHRTINPADISADGKLSIDVPAGYRLLTITGIATGGSGTAYLNIGKTAAASDLVAAAEFENDGTPNNIFLNETSITEVWISEVGGGFGFDGNTLTFELLIVKE